MLSSEAKQRIQWALALALIVSAVRAGYLFYERHQENVELQKHKQQQKLGYANADYYVTPKKLYPYDLKSAKQLTEQPVWVKEGYRYTYYPYDDSRHHTDFKNEAGLLLPIEKVDIKDVVTDVSPNKTPGEKQVLALFEKEGKEYGVPIGGEQGGTFKLYSDEMFFIQDPHDLYKHWPPDVWDSISKHEVKPGMNEMQADFAIGMGVPDSGSSLERTVRYPNGGKPLVVTYREGKAADIKPGTP